MAIAVNFLDLGLIRYQEAWDIQEKLFSRNVQLKLHNRDAAPDQVTPTQHHLLFCEHPHVYTLGKSGHESNLLVNAENLAAIGAEFFKINRGGDITYHGPGSIVAYPILDLDCFFTDLHLYLRQLEEAVIRVCAGYGIIASRIPGLTGVWIDAEGVNPRKICAMGVRCSRWVTMHGLSFNVNTNLDYFSHIVPCGIDDKEVTSLQKELGRQVDMAEVKLRLKKHLGELFDITFGTNIV